MLPTERIDYSAIADRPPRRLPGGNGLAVWLIVNVEEWSPTDPMPRTVLSPPAGGVPSPDIPNWAGTSTATVSASGGCSRSSTSTASPASSPINGSAITSLPARSPRRGDRARLGVRRPRLRPEEHAEGGRRDAPTSRTPPRRSSRQPERGHAAGWDPASPKPGKRPTSWSRKATSTSATGCSTTSRFN